jgi:hypothetical protein
VDDGEDKRPAGTETPPDGLEGRGKLAKVLQQHVANYHIPGSGFGFGNFVQCAAPIGDLILIRALARDINADTTWVNAYNLRGRERPLEITREGSRAAPSI